MANVYQFSFTAASALITETVTIAKAQLGTNDWSTSETEADVETYVNKLKERYMEIIIEKKDITIMHRRT